MQWNVSIPLTIFTLLILGVHFAKVEPRQGRLSVLLPAVFIYILYLSLLILCYALTLGIIFAQVLLTAPVVFKVLDEQNASKFLR